MSARRTALLLALALLAGGCADRAPAPAEGFAGLGGEREGFARVVPGKAFAFPADHGAHPDFRIEWWYLTANLRDADGRDYGVQWTLFRNALRPAADAPGWGNGNLWMGHAGMTTRDRHWSAQRMARGGVGQAGVVAVPFQAWIDDWSLQGDPAGELRARARGDGFGYRLRLQADGPLVLQGEQGFSRKSGGGQASYYYSQPFFRADGVLDIDGREVEVTGMAWMDREWSSQPLAADQVGWDWFSLHFDDGRRLMLFRLRHADGGDYLSGNWIAPDGRTTPLGAGDIRLRPLRTTRVADRDVPTRWALALPGHELQVQVEAINPDAWMDLDTAYWEGPVRVTGSAGGVGYLEMTGY
ncbi:iron ABC transporter permease [Luteimonas sp. SJ-92]|uniref:Iron ABC transporter permease n=1 Tax=Luteimonas salinisoli TaxID=2752307 RepID=A0A853JDB1_9GAMM|nr:lipocalin-like domain-containing protein [Luteimonas salinisoli]NZA26825.1 iron ABC transporter permease [Luteimonas salinisoli]